MLIKTDGTGLNLSASRDFESTLVRGTQRAGWHAAAMTARVTDIDQRATRLYKEQFGHFFADPPPKPKGRPSGAKGRGKKRRDWSSHRERRGRARRA
jgi:hypothetical protein